jgi:hypothetical protein
MKFISAFFLLVLSALVVVGCSDDDNPSANNTYTITAVSGANGTISPAGSTTVAQGASLKYTMTPASGYHVDSVIVDGVKVDSTLTYTFVNVTADHVIGVTFAVGAAPTSYVGVMAGTGVSGTLTINVPAAKRPYTPTAAPGDTIVITASLKINGGGTVPLTGFLVTASGEIYLEGGGYVFVGVLADGSVTGTFTYSGGNGIFKCDEGDASSIKTYCGRYQDNSPGTEAGYFNMTISGSTIFVVIYPDDAGGSAFSTTGSINTSNVISIYNPEVPSMVIATGTLNTSTGAVSGTYLGGGGGTGGTWSGGYCN